MDQPPNLYSDPLGFALYDNMITHEEHRACLRGEMEVLRKNFQDENHHGLVIRKITAVSAISTIYHPAIPLYRNRADDVLIKQILGET